MARLTDGIIQFLQNRGCVIVSTVDKNGFPHSACKEIVKINKNGRIYLLDLYKGKTYENLKRNANISITAVDEHRFKGYCLKGKAKIIVGNQLDPQIIAAWEARIVSRLTQRVLKLRKMIERKFAEAKKWHGLSRARYRGKWKVAIQILMTFLVINAKRITRLLKERLINPVFQPALAIRAG